MCYIHSFQLVVKAGVRKTVLQFSGLFIAQGMLLIARRNYHPHITTMEEKGMILPKKSSTYSLFSVVT